MVKLTREVLPRPRYLLRASHLVLATIASLAVLVASQQCAGKVSSRLDAVIARDPLPGRWK